MAEGRDKQSMGVVTSLTTVNPATPYQLNYRGESSGIVRGTGADWFGPLNPLEPTAPPEVKGRGFDIPSGYNLNIRPRAYEAITFDQLRSFADGYDLLRTVIETRKDQLARLSWNIVARGADKKKKAKDPKVLDQIAKVEKFFLRPDGEHFWDDWLRMVIEDLLVLDAPAIYRRRTFGGNLYALEPIDGGTIKRVIDDWGRTPAAPVPAYQQVLKGFPAVDYTVNDLIYRPRNIRTHKVYGYSPVEQIVMTINIAIRRQVWQLQSFTEGNIPEALIGTPSTWTPDQIRAFQDWFDSLLEGNTGERRRARFVPGEVSKGYVATKPSELFGDAEEWLARIVCFAFNISPQPFVAMMNRATAETAQETAAMDGLAPLQQWVKNLIDTVILDDFGYDDIEFQWLDEDELDPNIKSQIIDREVASGLLTMNEARAEKGLDPYDHEDADRPMFKSAQGYAPIFNTPEEEAEADARIAAADAKGQPGSEEVSPSAEGEVPGTDVAEGGDEAPGDGSPATPEAQKADSTGFKPPAGVQSAAKRGLELREKWGRGGITNSEASSQGIGSGVQRATNLKNGDSISLDTVRRMKAFFDRHEKNYDPDKKEDDGGPTAGTIAWLLWGGNAGRDWATSVLEREGVAEKSDRPFSESGLTKSDWDESKITRDERGRFGAGDGSFALPNEAKENGWSRGQAEAEKVSIEVAKVMSPEQVQDLRDAIANKADREVILEKMAPIYNSISESPPTLIMNEDGRPPAGFFDNREYNLPGGEKTDFEGAIDHLRGVAEGFAKDGMGYDKQATLILGPSAAGKSMFAEKLAVDMKAAIVDSDEAKKVIDGYNGGMGANAVHEESSFMNRAVEAQLVNAGANMVIPTVGANPEGINARMERLKEAGYSVRLVNVRVDKDEAARRMASRAIRSGRPIGVAYVRHVGDKPSATYHSLKGKADGFAEIEASGPKGSDRVTESNGLPNLGAGKPVLGKSGGSGASCCGPHGGGGVRLPLQKSRKPTGPLQFVDLDRRKTVKAERALRTRLRHFLHATSQKVAEQVREKLRAMGKADDEFDVDEFLRSLDLSMFEGLDEDFRDFLEDIYADSGKIALSHLGSRANDLVDQVNERSVSWAREHAADLAGVNEDSPYALDRTTRDMLRATIADGIENNLSAEEIGDQIEDAYAFSEERADLIAMTEVAAANSYGALAGYEEAASIGIRVRKSWLMLEDACPICGENADAGPIDLDEEFPSGDLAPPGHPNCRCVLVPEVEDEEGNVTEGETEEIEEE